MKKLILIGCLLPTFLMGMEKEMPQVLQQVTDYLNEHPPLIPFLSDSPPYPTGNSLYDEDDKEIVVSLENRVFAFQKGELNKDSLEGYYEIGKDSAWIFSDPVYENSVMALKILAQKAVDDKNVKRVDRYIVIGREGMLQVVSKIPLGLYRTTDIRIEKTPTEINEKTNENIDCRISFSTRSDAFFEVKDTDGDDVYIIHWLSQKIELCAAMLDG